jgi:hypothetical protein
MRWRFPDAGDAEENRERTNVERAIDRWWAAFGDARADLDAIFRGKKPRWDLPAWMQRHLGAIDARLMWEFGPGLSGGHRLVITPEVERHLRPLVETILARAPKIDGWSFYAHRLAETVPQAIATVQARVGFDFADVRASVEATGDGGVDVTFHSTRFATVAENAARGAAFVATESLLGEETLDVFIDAIETRADDRETAAIALDELPELVRLRIEEQRATLSPAAFFEREDVDWTLWEMKPRDAPDYPHQLDMFVGKSAMKEMWQRAHSSRSFASARFSRFRETFCFLKIDGSTGLDPDGFGDKSKIEDALDSALKPAGLGAHVGGGTGRRYSYVDLALIDVERAIPILRETLRVGRVPRRSWLLFFDDALRDEWVGIWPDSPLPPGITSPRSS